MQPMISSFSSVEYLLVRLYLEILALLSSISRMKEDLISLRSSILVCITGYTAISLIFLVV